MSDALASLGAAGAIWPTPVLKARFNQVSALQQGARQRAGLSSLFQQLAMSGITYVWIKYEDGINSFLKEYR